MQQLQLVTLLRGAGRAHLPGCDGPTKTLGPMAPGVAEFWCASNRDDACPSGRPWVGTPRAERRIVSPSRAVAGAVMHPFVSDVVSDEGAGA